MGYSRQHRSQPAGEQLRGELVEFNVRGSDMWGTGLVKTQQDGGEINVVGKLLGVSRGDTVELTGTWATHDRYGRQFRVTDCAVIIPQDASGVIGWLASKLPQISRRRAEELVQTHGVAGTWKVLDERAEATLCEIDGITPARAAEVFEAYHLHKAGRDQVVRLKGFGLTDGQVAKVLTTWGAKAEAELRADPYQLMRKVDGFGWERADQVAQRMGVPRDFPARIAAAISFSHDQGTFLGNTYIPQGGLVAAVATVTLGSTKNPFPEAPIRAELARMYEREELVLVLGRRVYAPKLDRAEDVLAKAFALRAKAAMAVANENFQQAQGAA